MLLPLILFQKRLHGTIIGTKQQDHRLLSIKIENFWQPLMLFGYAIFFSYAYVQLDAAIGALVLFPTVQITMMAVSMFQGNRVSFIELTGFLISFVGLIYLLLPGISAPPLQGTLLMAGSGICWAVYSLLGQKVTESILATSRNFLYTLPMVIILLIVIFINPVDLDSESFNLSGILLAGISGALASGIGYVLWYISLKNITTTQASISQLAVPVLAAVGGIVFLGEQVTNRLIIASILILGGIFMTIFTRKK